MHKKEFFIILGIVLILVEAITLLIAVLPGYHFLTELAKNPTTEQFIKNMEWIADFLIAQVLALPVSLLISAIIGVLLGRQGRRDRGKL